MSDPLLASLPTIQYLVVNDSITSKTLQSIFCLSCILMDSATAVGMVPQMVSRMYVQYERPACITCRLEGRYL